MLLFAELFLVLFAVYSIWNQYAGSENSHLLLLISFCTLSFFYLILSFYQIFIGLLSNFTTEGAIKVMAYCTFSVVVMGILFKINVWPGSTTTLMIGGFSLLGILAFISLRNRSIKQKVKDAKVSSTIRSIFYRLVPYMFVALFFIQIPIVTLYRSVGSLKEDPEAIRLLKACQSDKDKCNQFQEYQNKLISTNHANTRSPANR